MTASAPSLFRLPFPILESFLIGLHLTFMHLRLFAMLSVMPVVAAFGTLMAVRLGGGVPFFWAPLAQAPAYFIQGLQCALIVRFLLLQEFPLIADDETRRARNRDVIRAGIVFMIFTYLYNGLITAVIYVALKYQATPEVLEPYTPLIMTAMVLVFWSVRWYWLMVPVTLGWDVKGMYARLKGWRGSVSIGLLFILCAATVNITTGLLRQLLCLVTGAQTTGDLTGVWAVLDDIAVSAGSVALGVVFFAASAHAIRTMLPKKASFLV